MKKFILYIVFIYACFNSLICFANDKSNKIENIVEQEYIIRDFSKKIKEIKDDKVVIKTNRPIGSIFILPYLVDKLYVGDDIKSDITPLLKMMYPKTNEKALNVAGDVIKSIVYIKRGYKKVLGLLEYNIKAKRILPKDAPIIAKKGEYIREDEILTPTSAPGEYKITNNLRKYLEYDKGALGEPVRMRDKNYIPTPDVDELALAILDFDIRRIRNTIEKMPKYNDGSAEKPYIGPHDLRARVLLNTSRPGDKETIFGVIDIRIPDGYYINGDILNKNTEVVFKLKEIEDEDLNIKDYQIFKPLANGFEKDGVYTRALLDRVSFPFIINRKDVNKKTIISGDFFFELCKLDGSCEKIKTEHNLILKDTIDDEASIYYNHVMQSHARIPQNELKFAKVDNVVFDEKQKQLKVFIKHEEDVSNLAVMIEDEKSTNFLNPKYEINENESIATFDVSFVGDDVELSDLGISVSLNDKYSFRAIKNISLHENIEQTYNSSIWDFFVLGLIASFSPGIFYLIIKLIYLLNTKEKKIRIFIRYIFSFIISLLVFIKLLQHNIGYKYLYFVVSAIFVEASLLFAILGYMDFSLFRPLRKFLKHGYVLGIFTSLLFIGFPLFGEEFISMFLSLEHINNKILGLFLFVIGLLLFTIFCFLLHLKKRCFNLTFNALNAIYGIFYLVICFYFLWVIGGTKLWFLILIITSILLLIWYYYPVILTNSTKGKTLSKKNIIIFNKLQYFTFLIVFIVFICTFVSISIFPYKKITNPSIEETLNVIDSQLEKNRPILVCVSSNWNFYSLFNNIILSHANQNGLAIAYINNYTPSKEGDYWLKRYNKPYSNLYVLFSNRHKNGIILPDNLSVINFKQSIKNFN